MGDFLKKLDDFMTSDLIRRVGGGVCLIAVILVGVGFFFGAKNVLKTMKPDVAVVAVDEETSDDDAMSDDAEEEGDEEEDYEDEEDYDE